jgi:hypothetical protein
MISRQVSVVTMKSAMNLQHGQRIQGITGLLHGNDRAFWNEKFFQLMLVFAMRDVNIQVNHNSLICESYNVSVGRNQ